MSHKKIVMVQDKKIALVAHGCRMEYPNCMQSCFG